MSPPRSAPTPVIATVTAAGSLVLGLFIFRPGGSEGEVRAWTAADHDQPAGAQPQPTGRAKGQPRSSDSGDLTELAWSKHCATCHGKGGRGDGPQAPMAKAPDLTRADWLEETTDAEIAQTIRQGRNAMPAFDLPPAVVQGLVQRIRGARPKR